MAQEILSEHFQTRISDLFQGRMSKFSVETLMDWLDKLGKKVVVIVQDKHVAKVVEIIDTAFGGTKLMKAVWQITCFHSTEATQPAF